MKPTSTLRGRVSHYVRSLFPPEELSVSHKQEEGLGEMYRAVTSRAWRRTAVDDEAARDIKKKIATSVDRGEPIKFSIPSGGYKSWHENRHPGINWAEILCLAYMSKNARRISKIYKGGVEIDITFASGVMGLVSNFDDTGQYRQELGELAKAMSGHGVSIRAVDISELVGGTDVIIEEMKANFETIRDNWKRGKHDISKRVESARRNFKIKGIIDYSGLDDIEMGVVYRESAMMCEALDSVSARREYNKYSDRIQLVFVRGPRLSLHVGSCETSCFHPWVGSGLLESVGVEGVIRGRILSYRAIQSRDWVPVEHGVVKAGLPDDMRAIPVVQV